MGVLYTSTQVIGPQLLCDCKIFKNSRHGRVIRARGFVAPRRRTSSSRRRVRVRVRVRATQFCILRDRPHVGAAALLRVNYAMDTLFGLDVLVNGRSYPIAMMWHTIPSGRLDHEGGSKSLLLGLDVLVDGGDFSRGRATSD